MVAPVLLYGGLVAVGAILMATGKKRSLETDTLGALQSEDPAKVNVQAGRFDALNDDTTGALLRSLADRMQGAKSGAVLPPAHEVDPDNTGEPGVSEWTGTLLTQPFSDAALIRWADAYDAKGWPGAAKLLRDKAAEDDTPREVEADELPASLQAQLSALLQANDDPFAMNTLSQTLKGMGRDDLADELDKAAAAIRAQWAADEAEADAAGETFKDTGVTVTPAGNVVPLPKPAPSAPSTSLPNALPQATLDAIAAALAGGDPKKMLELADGLENIGATIPAQQLRARALEIQAAAPKPAPKAEPTKPAKSTPKPAVVAPKPAPVATKPAPVVVAPKPAPVVVAPKPAPVVVLPKPVVPNTHTVKSGESPWSVATLYTGDGNKWRELVKANPKYPVDAKTGSFKNFYAGMVLTIPSTWKASTSTVATANSRYELAQKANANLLTAPVNKEDKALVKQFQLQEGAAKVGTPDGLYGPKSGYAIAAYGIVPAKPRYWSSKTKSADMAAWKARMAEYAKKDPARASEWLAAGKV